MARPYFKHPPNWILEDVAYPSLSPTGRFLLVLIMGQCKEKIDDVGSMRGCRAKKLLLETSGIKTGKTFDEHVKTLREMGYVVKVGQGKGRNNANEYAVPGRKGAIDHLDVGDDEQFKTKSKLRKGCRNDTLYASTNGSPPSDEALPTALQKGVDAPIKGRNSVPEREPESSQKGVKSTPLYSHHQQEIPNTDNLSPTNHVASGTPSKTHSETRINSESRCDDDQSNTEEHQLELPDNASEQHVCNALCDFGVSPRRAQHLAARATPALAREAILRCSNQNPNNRGAYLSQVLETVMDEHAAAQKRADAERFKRESVLLHDAEENIDKMSDEEIMEAFWRYCDRTNWPKEGFTAEFIRSRPNTRKMIARQLMIEQNANEEPEKKLILSSPINTCTLAR